MSPWLLNLNVIKRAPNQHANTAFKHLMALKYEKVLLGEA